MDIIGKLQNLKRIIANDGSQELADHYIEIIQESREVDALVQNSAFLKILGKMKLDFKIRVQELVKKDPELASIKKMFVRTVGMKGAEEQIQKSIEEFINESEVK